MSDPPPRRPTPVRPVQYKGADLEAEKGPGLGCFWSQLAALGILVVLTPVSVNLGWPDWVSALLLFATIAVLLVSGQTIIFLLRLVAAERREGRRRPLAASSRTVGELEDAPRAGEVGDAPPRSTGGVPDDPMGDGPVRQ